MTTDIPRIGHKARFKFFAAYAFSIGLVVFLVSWLRQDAGAATQIVEVTKEVPKEVTVVKNIGSELAVADEMLHQKMDALNKLYSGAVWQNDKSPAKDAIQSAENSFKASLDSLEKKAALLTNEQEKQQWTTLITSFKNNFVSRNALFASYSQLKAAETTVKPIVQNTQETDQLKNTITEKDKLIASLQTRLNQRPAVIPSTSNDGEWKTKYNQQKATSDKLNAQVSELKRGYQTVIEDNKRLLAKIQAGKQ